MFWCDPKLYGADLPYREFRNPVQSPFMGPISPWQNMPRFLPPEYYGTAPQLFNVPTAFNVPPMFNTLPMLNVPPMFNTLPMFNVPPTYDVPPMYNIPPIAFSPQFRGPAFNPFVQPQTTMNLPLHNLYRPYI